MYKHILVAVDLTEEGAQVVSRAIELQRVHSSHLSFVHVVESISYAYGNIEPDPLFQMAQGSLQRRLQLESAKLREL